MDSEGQEVTTAVPETQAPAKKKVKKTAPKKPAKKAIKKAAAKKPAKKAASGEHKGRQSAYNGRRIIRAKADEETGLRKTGRVRECWDAIPKGTRGILFKDYRVAAGKNNYGLARLALAGFLKKGIAKLLK
jgi:hypothetical protein